MHSKFKTPALLTAIFFYSTALFSQIGFTDSNKINKPDTTIIILHKKEQVYKLSNGNIFIYTKPMPFGFITNLPQNAKGIVASAFKKKNIKPLLFIGGTTLALFLADQPISIGVRQFSKKIHFNSKEEYRDIINLKVGKADISIYKAPKNLNTALYQMGQGFPGLLIGAGLFTYGKIHKDYRALSTASQLAESFILMGISTQLLKRITGRQSPGNATDDKGGEWHFFPSFKNYQTNTPNYDAFPSGHLATMMSTVTILAENYPEKKYIKPVGYLLIALTGLSMINNNVHWASDYPLAIGLGYLCAKQVLRKNRKTVSSTSFKKNKTGLAYTFNYYNGRLIPGLVYKF